MDKVNRFSLEERYGYQNRKVIYDKDTDNDIELSNIYPIIELLNKCDKQITDLKKQLEIFKLSNEALQQDNLDLSYDKVDLAYEYAQEMAEHWEKEYKQEIAELQKQLEEKQKEFDDFKRIGDKGHLNDLLEDKRKENRLLIRGYEQLEQQFADKEKEVQDLKEKLETYPAEIVGKIRQAVEKEKSDNDLAWLGFNKLDRILNIILKWSLK